MDSKDKNSFQVVNNNFQNFCSDFAFHTTLNTTAYMKRPFYAKLSVAKNMTGIKILGIKTSQSIMQVYYKNGEFQEHRKLALDDNRLEKQAITTFTFKNEVFSAANPPAILIGYQSGLVAYTDCIKERVLGFYNYDERNRTLHKAQTVSEITVLPAPNNDEILVTFEDSTALRYKLTLRAQNDLFVDKIRKFEAKTSFNRTLNRFKHKMKTKENLTYCRFLSDSRPEFSNFFAFNEDEYPQQNPVAYYKFNHRTISDIVVKRHASFIRTLGLDAEDDEISVLAFTSLDGYLVLFELNRMVPLLSYKGYFGGINTLTFSENCELVALCGQDDYITVLDLNTRTTLRCEGHKSFVSKAIFQPISFGGDETTRERDDITSESARGLNRTMDRGEDNGFIRIIGAGMDGNLSFWEFHRDVFLQIKKKKEEIPQIPIRLNLGTMQSFTLKPVHMEPVKDAIGWIELCDNMLTQCGYDGVISTYIIRDIIDSEETARDPLPSTRRVIEAPSKPSPDMKKYEEKMYAKRGESPDRRGGKAQNKEEEDDEEEEEEYKGRNEEQQQRFSHSSKSGLKDNKQGGGSHQGTPNRSLHKSENNLLTPPVTQGDFNTNRSSPEITENTQQFVTDDDYARTYESN